MKYMLMLYADEKAGAAFPPDVASQEFCFICNESSRASGRYSRFALQSRRSRSTRSRGLRFVPALAGCGRGAGPMLDSVNYFC